MSSLAFSPPPRQTISALRGLVCLMIVAFHFHPTTFHEWWFDADSVPSPRWIATNFRFGYSSFFLLAGYFFAHSFRSIQAYLSIRAFVTKRILRLAIPYWVALLVVGLGLNLLADWYRGRDRIDDYLTSWPALLFLQNVMMRTNGVPEPLWFMAPLVHFFVIWCSLFWLIRRGFLLCKSESCHRRTMAVMIALTALVFIVSALISYSIPDLKWTLGRNAHFLALGCGVYWTCSRDIRPWWLFAAFAVEVILACALGSSAPISASIMGILLVALSGSKPPSGRLVELFGWIGTFSYSIYLTHASVGSRVYNVIAGSPVNTAPPLLAFIGFVAAIAASVAFGYVFYVVVERPSRRLIDNVRYRE